MDRRNFFKKLGIVAGTAAVAPTIFADLPKVKPQFEDELGILTYLPKGNKLHKFRYDTIAEPEISIDIERKRIVVYRYFKNFEEFPRVTIQHIYKKVQEKFDESFYLDEETPMYAFTPTMFGLKNGWDFFVNKDRIVGGSWEYEGMDLSYVSVYGLGYITEPDYVEIKCYGGELDGWQSLGNGVIYDKNDTGLLFERCIPVINKKKTRLIFGAFDSRGEMLDVFSTETYGNQRLAVPFCVNYPITKHTSNYVRNKYRSYLG